MVLAQGAQDGQGDRMVAAEPHHVLLRREQRAHFRLQRFAHGRQRGIGERQVAGIGQLAQRGGVEMRMNGVAQHARGAADGLRSETRTRAIGHGAIVGKAGEQKRQCGRILQPRAIKEGTLAQKGEFVV